MLAGLLSPEGLTGVAGLTSKMAPSCGHWEEASNPCQVELSLGLHDMQLASPRASDTSERQRQREQSRSLNITH